MNNTPLIGMTTLCFERNSIGGHWFVSNNTYSQAILACGAIPLPIPSNLEDQELDIYLDKVDGVLFIGGPDLPPKFYGQEPCFELNTLPDFVAKNHLSLVRKTYDKKIPMLGICLGMQEFNVAFGGKLIQDLQDKTPIHRISNPLEDQVHMAEILPDTKLSKIFSAGKITVNSCHHQALDSNFLAKELKIAAMCDDVIEAVEFPGDIFRIGVQCHPERILDKSHQEKLFSSFIYACKK